MGRGSQGEAHWRAGEPGLGRAWGSHRPVRGKRRGEVPSPGLRPRAWCRARAQVRGRARDGLVTGSADRAGLRQAC